MSRKNFVTVILATVGGLLFGVGMCCSLLPEWDAFNAGIALGIIGAVILIVMAAVRRKMAGKPPVKLSGRTVGAIMIGVVGALLLGVGMCMVMVWEMMVWGILVGIAGIAVLICLIPFVKGLK